MTQEQYRRLSELNTHANGGSDMSQENFDERRKLLAKFIETNPHLTIATAKLFTLPSGGLAVNIEPSEATQSLKIPLPQHSIVNHPSHYNAGKIEVIEALEDWDLGFHLGNVVKYVARAGKKDPTKVIEDLSKAEWYLKRKIELLKAVAEKRDVIRPNDMNPRNTNEKDKTT